MLLNRLIAFPESRRILRMHLLAQIFIAVDAGLFSMVPVLLRGRFGASEWQTLLATSAQSFMSLLAIFWNDLYARVGFARYLLILFCLSTLPLAGVATVSTAGAVLAFVIFAAMGIGGIHSVQGDLLRSCYPPQTRSRIWSLLKITDQIVIIIVAYLIGRWLDHDRNSYRYFFPICVALIGTGMMLIARISEASLFRDRLAARKQPTRQVSPLQAYRDMYRVLREDVQFRRYETAFCIYGLGWMICHAMLPYVIIDVLHLTYEQAAVATQVVFQSTMLAMLLPAGYLMDKLGPIRLSVWAFACLLLYPATLSMAHGVGMLAVASFMYGLSMSGVNLAWTLGPVSLAKDASQASQYLAIHATLVSLRALLGQVPAVAYYYFARPVWGAERAVVPPLIAATLMFSLGSVLMWRLDRDRRRKLAQPADELPPDPPAVTASAET